jgi:hypothetical protein
MFNLFRPKRSLLEDQIRVYLAYCIRNHREGNYGFWLREFAQVYEGDAYDIEDEDIDEFLVDIGAIYFGQSALIYAERAVRGLRTFYVARSRSVAQKEGKAYDRALMEKSLRNREIVKLRQEDPVKWSWRKLGVIFDLHFTRVKEIYNQSASKYGEEVINR